MAAPEENKDKFVEIDVDLIDRDPEQPRKEFDQEALQELADSIREVGIIQPIVVIEVSDCIYQIVAGERRWRAAQLAQLDKVPAIVKKASKLEIGMMTMIENIQRKNLNPIEEANGYKMLMDEFKLTQQEVADATGKARSAIANAVRLLTLTDKLKELIVSGDLSSGQGKLLAALPHSLQSEIGVKAAKGKWTVRKLSAEIEKSKRVGSDPGAAQEVQLALLERHIGETVGAPVKIESGDQGKGSIQISFHSLDEFDGLLERLRVKPLD